MSNRIDKAKTKSTFSRLARAWRWHRGCRKLAHQEPWKKRDDYAAETEWRFMPGARADHRGCAERARPAVRVRRWPAAAGDRGQGDGDRQSRDFLRRGRA